MARRFTPSRRRYRRDEDGRRRLVVLNEHFPGVEGYNVAWTQECSGCTEQMENGGRVFGPFGCRECGYTGKVRVRWWQPFDLDLVHCPEGVLRIISPLDRAVLGEVEWRAGVVTVLSATDTLRPDLERWAARGFTATLDPAFDARRATTRPADPEFLTLLARYVVQQSGLLVERLTLRNTA